MATAPKAVREANVVIIGGGPSGSLAAAMLNARGVRATLVEQEVDFLDFNENRAYYLGMYPRGIQALKAVPGLFEHVSPSGTWSDKLVRIPPDGAVREMRMPSSIAYLFFISRFSLNHALKQFVTAHTRTHTLYGTTVEHIDFLPSGDMEVTIRRRHPHAASDDNSTTEEKHTPTETLRTKLILACDGRRSTVLQALRASSRPHSPHYHAKDSPRICSAKGFDQHLRTSPSVGMMVKSIVINNTDVFRSHGVTTRALCESLTVLPGAQKIRRTGRSFQIVIFPMGEQDVELLHGVLGVIVLVADHALWHVKSTREAFALFQENLPQLDVRAAISEASMDAFVRQPASAFPALSRPLSLAAAVGAPHLEAALCGGAVVLGDAAHSFPPDSGQGVSSSLEDVACLMSVLDSAPDSDSIPALLRRYEAARDDDVWALMRIAQVASPYQYRQSIWSFRLQLANFLLRTVLAKALPVVFQPPLVLLNFLNEPYSEILRRADSTTFRLMAVLAFVLMLPLLYAGYGWVFTSASKF